jgi:hypothetical protein
MGIIHNGRENAIVSRAIFLKNVSAAAGFTISGQIVG